MTPEQSEKAVLLEKKIADNEKTLKALRKSDAAIEERKIPSALVKLSYHSKAGVDLEVIIDPEWFYSPELRSDFQYCAKIAKDGFMELLEKDLQFMKEELGKLQ